MQEWVLLGGEYLERKKHALLITAYQEIDYLIELCEVYTQYFFCYIHIDKKCKEFDKIERLKMLNNVFVFSKYKINWGSYRHVSAILELLQRAKDDDMDYFHIISANTVLIKNPAILYQFFEKNPNQIYMEVTTRGNGSFYEFDYRYTSYFFQHLYNLRGSWKEIWIRFEKYSSKIQRKLRIRKGIELNYKGYVYCHLPNIAVEYIIEYVKENPQYIKMLKYCY